MKHELTYEERAVWGECPVCHAEHGEPCYPEVGFALGRSVSGRPPANGVHLGRLQRAPHEIEVDGYAQLLLKRLAPATAPGVTDSEE